MTINKTKTILVLSIAAILALSAAALTSSTLTTAMAQVTNVPPPTPTSPCPPDGQVEHWDKIIFSIDVLREGNGIVHTIGKIPGQFFNTQLDLKVPDQPGVVANLKQEIIDALANQFPLTPTDKIALFNSIHIVDDKYEIVTCGQTGPAGPVGPAGPPGPPCTGGSGGTPTSFYIATTHSTLNGFGGPTVVTARCSPGDSVTGGGYILGTVGVAETEDLQGNYATSSTDWTVVFLDLHSSEVTVQAICAHP